MELVAIKLFFSALFGGLGSFLSKMVRFLTTKPGVYILAGLLALGTVWKANDLGYQHGVAQTEALHKLADARAIANAYQAGLVRQQSMDKALSTIAYKAGLAQGIAQQQATIIIKRIPVYVTAETDRTFPVPCGLYRVLNAAAAGTDPETVALPAGLADGDACPITASDIAEHGVTVAGLYHKAEAQIAGLQALVNTIATEIEQ